MTINQNKKRAFSYKTVQHSVYKKAVGVRLGYLPLEQKKKPLKIKGFSSGRNRTRTCDPIDMNDVLYLCGLFNQLFFFFVLFVRIYAL